MIDEARVDELERDFGAEDLAQLIHVFLEEVSKALGVLQGLAADGSVKPVRDQLHFLKGCARNLGAVRLGDLCAGFEDKPESFGDSDISGLFAEFRDVETYFRGRVQAEPA